MTATRVVSPSPRDPQAAPTRTRATATAAGRPPGSAAPGPRPRRPAPTTRTDAARTAAAGTAAASTAATARAGASTAATARPLPLTPPRPKTPPARRTPLRIVSPPDPAARGRLRRRLWVGALAGLACAGLFAIVGVRVLLAQAQGPVDKLESQVTAAQAENQRLRLDVARLESPSRIVAEAQTRLGMIPPAVVTYLPPLEERQPEPSPTTPAG